MLLLWVSSCLSVTKQQTLGGCWNTLLPHSRAHPSGARTSLGMPGRALPFLHCVNAHCSSSCLQCSRTCLYMFFMCWSSQNRGGATSSNSFLEEREEEGKKRPESWWCDKQHFGCVRVEEIFRGIGWLMQYLPWFAFVLIMEGFFLSLLLLCECVSVSRPYMSAMFQNSTLRMVCVWSHHRFGSLQISFPLTNVENRCRSSLHLSPSPCF